MKAVLGIIVLLVVAVGVWLIGSRYGRSASAPPPIASNPTGGPTQIAVGSTAESSSRNILWGVSMGSHPASIAALESLVGGPMDAVMAFSHWGNDPDFPTRYNVAVRDAGKTLVLFWEAYDYERNPLHPSQSAYGYDAVLSGELDSFFKRFAEGAREYGGPVILVLYSEFNGDWYPYGVSLSGNSPEKFVAAYRHIRGFFADAQNVRFAWVPNSASVPDVPANRFERSYPGDAYVDYVGVDGFNFGGSQHQTFAEIFDDPLTRLATYGKPIWIFSMASADFPDKPEWITDALTVQLPAHPSVEGFLWFNENKERDWRIDSSPESLAEFKDAVL